MWDVCVGSHGEQPANSLPPDPPTPNMVSRAASGAPRPRMRLGRVGDLVQTFSLTPILRFWQSQGKGASLASAGGCCFEPVCKGANGRGFPGVTPCGRCEWTCTPCGVLASIIFPVLGLICCCVPDCAVGGCVCNKAIKRDDAPVRRAPATSPAPELRPHRPRPCRTGPSPLPLRRYSHGRPYPI